MGVGIQVRSQSLQSTPKAFQATLPLTQDVVLGDWIATQVGSKPDCDDPAASRTNHGLEQVRAGTRPILHHHHIAPRLHMFHD